MSRIKILSLNSNGYMCGEDGKSRTKRRRSRTQKTYHKKVAKLKKFYNSHPKIKDKYLSFEQYLAKIPLKKTERQDNKRVIMNSEPFKAGSF